MVKQSDRTETKPEPKPQPKSNGKKKPIELSEDKILDTKFTLSVQTMVGRNGTTKSLIGMWYTLQGEIEEKTITKFRKFVSKRNIHQDQRVIIEQGLMNNIKTK